MTRDEGYGAIACLLAVLCFVIIAALFAWPAHSDQKPAAEPASRHALSKAGVDASMLVFAEPADGCPRDCSDTCVAEVERGRAGGPRDCCLSPGALDPMYAITYTPYDNPAAVAGKIAVVRRGGCSYYTKGRRGIASGALGVLIVDIDDTLDWLDEAAPPLKDNATAVPPGTFHARSDDDD
jgi:hypothetical protein